jgi:hypothetical protein
MRPNDLDLTPWAVAMAVLGARFGPTFAAYISAYGLIMVGWFFGLMIGLYNRSPDSKLPVWAYGLVTLIACIMVTVTLSKLLVATIPGFQVEYTSMLFPVAAAIAGFPDKWGQFGVWLLDRWQAMRGVKQ